MDETIHRIERLERRLVWILGLSFSAIVLILLGFLACAVAIRGLSRETGVLARLPSAETVGSREMDRLKARVVQAQSFEVVDAKGQFRGSWSADTDGNWTGFIMRDQEGHERVAICVYEWGAPALQLLYRRTEQDSASLIRCGFKDGRPLLRMQDANGSQVFAAP